MTDKEQKAEYDKKYREANKKANQERNKQWYELNKEIISKRNKEYRINNKQIVSEYDKNNYKRNREVKLKRSKEYSILHKNQKKIYDTKYRQENKDLIAEYTRNKLFNNVGLKLLKNCRSRVGKAIKHNCKSSHTRDLIGCTVEELKAHLKNQFTEGMTFENYGEWHLDHIKPCSLFNFENEADQRECFNYKNLQPLWAIDNISKSNKY